MNYWADFEVWRERRGELLREAQERRLAREGRKVREAFKLDEGGSGAGEISVRWGLPEDDRKVADLLELNGMPRWVAFEERFVIAEVDGKVLAALRYRTEPKKLLLGLLVVDPWAGERRVAVALYAGARELAQELGVKKILAKTDRHRDYPYEAGYHWWGGRWRSDAALPLEARDELPAGGWRRVFALLSATAVPFFRAFRP